MADGDRIEVTRHEFESLEARVRELEQKGAVWDLTMKLVHLLVFGVLTTIVGLVVALVAAK